jgi:hypothetical protein
LVYPVTKLPQVVVFVPQAKPPKLQRTPYPTRQIQQVRPPKPIFPSSEVVTENFVVHQLWKLLLMLGNDLR